MLKLKRVEENDLITLRGIKNRAFEEEFERLGFVPEDMVNAKWHISMMENSIYYKILDDNTIVGGVNIFKNEIGECYLCSLFIDKALQNKGYGAEVINILEALNCDATRWRLETPSMSTQNHHFYEKCGYQYVDDMVPEGAPEGFSLRVYEKFI